MVGLAKTASRASAAAGSGLPADELIRADRFRFEQDRQWFIVRRGLLRAILGCYLGIAPDRVYITYGHHEKPTLADNRSDNAVFRTLPADKKQAAFFNCWTRKEAYIKARGEGLSIPLDQFEVSLVPGEPTGLLSSELNPEEVSRWSLHAFNPATGYIAALVVEGHGLHFSCAQWTE